jgi:hypothetical protein
MLNGIFVSSILSDIKMKTILIRRFATMKKIIFFILTFFLTINFCHASSIILPFWLDDKGDVFDTLDIYTMFVITNTSVTNDTVRVRFYGTVGNPQASGPVERTIKANTLDIFGSHSYPGSIKPYKADEIGYAVASETDGKLLAVGLIYDASAHAGYVIPCFKGNDDLVADPGW